MNHTTEKGNEALTTKGVGADRKGSIANYCRSTGIGRQMFYQMERFGLGPTTIDVFGRRVITEAAKVAWEARAATREWQEKMAAAKRELAARREAVSNARAEKVRKPRQAPWR